AVMGCVVNGPGESRDADVGLAAGKGKGAIFRKGEVVRVVPEEQFLSALMEEGQRVIAERFPDSSAPPPADDLDAVIPMTVVEPGSRPGRVARR
ncbi:MAG: flavodoxin-dependent (E)-4-hydroxy-3-methylbut-2-enyl-diphosphate synthase, partial [Thermoanaerobaculia bacterium]